MVEPRLSWGPILECRLMGSPPPGVPPGDDAQDGAMRILGVMRVLSESLRLGNALCTLRRLLSGDEGEPPNHHPPSTPESESSVHPFTCTPQTTFTCPGTKHTQRTHKYLSRSGRQFIIKITE